MQTDREWATEGKTESWWALVPSFPPKGPSWGLCSQELSYTSFSPKDPIFRCHPVGDQGSVCDYGGHANSAEHLACSSHARDCLLANAFVLYINHGTISSKKLNSAAELSDVAWLCVSVIACGLSPSLPLSYQNYLTHQSSIPKDCVSRLHAPRVWLWPGTQ